MFRKYLFSFFVAALLLLPAGIASAQQHLDTPSIDQSSVTDSSFIVTFKVPSNTRSQTRSIHPIGAFHSYNYNNRGSITGIKNEAWIYDFIVTATAGGHVVQCNTARHHHRGQNDHSDRMRKADCGNLRKGSVYTINIRVYGRSQPPGGNPKKPRGNYQYKDYPPIKVEAGFGLYVPPPKAGTGSHSEDSNVGGGDDCVPESLVQDLRSYQAETHHGSAHVERWTRALAGLGRATHANPMDLNEALQMRKKYSRARWDPIVEAMRKLLSDAWDC